MELEIPGDLRDRVSDPRSAGQHHRPYHHPGMGRRRDGAGYAIAHRVSWGIHNGPIPPGVKVLHTCDNPPCVNPAHLFLGTQADNIKDCLDKGRANYGTLSGSDNGNAKLTETEVLAIREKYASGKIFQRELAKEYGVTQTHISYLVREKNWRYLAKQN